MLKRWRLMARKTLPACMPREDDAAAWWWIGMQEPYDQRSDQPRQVPIFGKNDEYRIEYPYIKRICQTLTIFLNLPERKQQIVIAAREDGFWWRGEHEDVLSNGEVVWQFALVLREYERQQEIGADAYRAECLKRMKAKKAGQALPYDPRKPLFSADKVLD